MLPSQFRLRASADIERAIRLGMRAHTPFATLYLFPRESGGGTRIACVVGKRVDKTAVIRHAVQRKLRAAANALPLALDRPYDMVIVARNSQARLLKGNEITQYILHAIRTAISD